MKRLFTFFIAVALVLTMAVPVLAEGTPLTAPGTTNTNMSYAVASTYSVTIPASVTIDTGTKAGSLTVGVAENAFIEFGKSIKVKLTTCDFLLTNNGDNIAYSISKGATPIAINDDVLTHRAGTLDASSAVLNLAVTGSAKYSGSYTDTITFTVSVE